MSSIDLDSTELCLIDSAIQNLRDVPLRPHLLILNVHSNYISHIENLSHLRCLKHLDLSANQISRIEGLDSLVSLRTLNLSCNLVARVEGLAGLRSLVKLNLSYNQIDDLSGFKPMSGPEYQLSHVELHGNRLSSSEQVCQCLCHCQNLRQLILSHDGSSNPLCHKSGYQRDILSGMDQLHSVDGIDKLGRQVGTTEVLADIPGLDDYIDYLLSNTETDNSSKDPEVKPVVTPKIDQALEMFRQRLISISDVSTTASATDVDVNASVERPSRTMVTKTGTEQESRLEQLERQIADLLSETRKNVGGTDDGKRSKAAATKHVAKRDVDLTDESDSEAGAKGGARKGRKSKLPSYRKSTVASRARKDQTSSSEIQSSKDGTESADLPVLSSEERVPLPGDRPASQSDNRIRNDIQSTYVQIMQELEQERERRWKAEQASKKLVDYIQKLQSKGKEDDQLRDVAVEATSRLKQTVTNERESRLKLQDEVDRLKEQLQQAVHQLAVAKETEESQRSSIRVMEETVAKMEREKLQQQTHEHKKIQDSQLKAAALGREAELLRSTVDQQKGQIQQLQSLLATREQEHREEMKHRYSLGSREMQEALQEELKKLEKGHLQQMNQQQEKVDVLSKQYSELEDEFRMALQIESNRFKELQQAFETISEENATNKQALLAAQRKDEKSTQMLNELTAMVKEQKGRIAELSKAKQEQSVECRERVQVLEAHVEEARKRMVTLELLKQDKAKLTAQVQAQDSVIAGLRAERKLWGQELAQQGASLAQDRGMLEARADTYKSEVISLKKQLERETDALKIKTKMLEDQTETIRKLKEGLVERDEEIKKSRQEALKIQQSLEDQLAEERTANQDAQEPLDRLKERKDNLKRQVADLEAELDDSKKAHGVLNTKWKEKSQLIGQLELQVREMKESWESKEKKLSEERNKALQAANMAIDKLRTADDAFRKQLEDKVQAYQEEIARLEQEKHAEVEGANQRVYVVEEEMRELLKETQASKRAMEEKIKRMTRAMSDLQSDLL